MSGAEQETEREISGPEQETVGTGAVGVAIDVNGPKRRGGVLRSWVRVDAATGALETVEFSKLELMRRLDLPVRDLRLLDPSFVCPSAILGRERAVVCNLEQIRCIITADEVFVLLDHRDPAAFVPRYVEELQRRLVDRTDDLPFEFIALEVALDAACSALDGETATLEVNAYPLLDELTTKISTCNLDRVRSLKSRLVNLTRRVQKVRDEIEKLMDDDGDMAEMYLTEKKMKMEATMLDDDDLKGVGNNGQDTIKSFKGAGSSKYNIDELAMLLDAYFVVSDSTLNKLIALKEYIDDSEDFINMELDNVRNQLIQFELLLTTTSFVVGIFGVVSGVFGMNFDVPLFKVPHAFMWTLVITGICSAVISCFFLFYFKKRRFL